MQEKETGVVERGDAFNHGSINAIIDCAIEIAACCLLAFQLILRFAMLANVVFDRRVCFGSVYGVFAADGAVYVAGKPVFCQDPRNLCGAFVACDQGCVES